MNPTLSGSAAAARPSANGVAAAASPVPSILLNVRRSITFLLFSHGDQYTCPARYSTFAARILSTIAAASAAPLAEARLGPTSREQPARTAPLCWARRFDLGRLSMRDQAPA